MTTIKNSTKILCWDFSIVFMYLFFQELLAEPEIRQYHMAFTI